jgi:hypothetical protein
MYSKYLCQNPLIILVGFILQILLLCGVRINQSLVFCGVRINQSLVFCGVRINQSLVFCGVRINQSLVFCVVFYGSLFVFFLLSVALCARLVYIKSCSYSIAINVLKVTIHTGNIQF